MLEKLLEKKTLETVGLVIAVIGIAALILSLLAGVAGFDNKVPEKLTVTRVCGSVAFIGVVLNLGYRPYRPARLVPLRSAVFLILPALIVVINNLPILPLLSGEAIVLAESSEIFAFAVECLFIGIFEETAFRGILLLTIVDKYGKTREGLFWSAVGTSAFFGIAHLFNLFGGADVGATFLQAGYSFLIGAMCSLILLLTGSLASCCILHAIYDFGGYLVPRLGAGTVWTGPEMALTAVIGSAAFVFYFYSSRLLSPRISRRLVGAAPKKKKAETEAEA